MNNPKYRLIKCYPGMGTIGYILNPQNAVGTRGYWYWHNNLWFNPEDFPEYWEPIKLVAFKTEDGHEVHGEYTLFTVGITTNCDNADYWKVSECKLNFISPPNLVDYKWFYSCVNAEKYIQENKPQFSNKDMLEFANYSTKNFRFDNYPNLDYWINHVKR